MNHYTAQNTMKTSLRTGQPLVVVITGASAGVGRATALEFAKRGARIGLLARGQKGLDATVRDVELAAGCKLGGGRLIVDE